MSLFYFSCITQDGINIFFNEDNVAGNLIVSREKETSSDGMAH